MRRPSTAREALGLSPLVKARGAYAPRIERVPLVSAGAEPFVFFAGQPTTEWAADARAGWAVALLFLKLAVWSNRGSFSPWTHLFDSLNSLFFGKAAPIFSNHPYFLATETCILYRHSEE